MTSHESNYEKTKRELIRNILAATSTTSFCVCLLNPLDVLRIQWQTRPSKDGRKLFPFAMDLMRHNGGFMRALFLPGIGVNAASVSFSSGTRLGLYPITKETISFILGQTDTKDANPFVMFISGFISGAFGFFLSTPFFAAKIRAQSYNAPKDKGGRHILIDILKSSSPFRGWSILVLRGALFSAGFSFGYDGTKTKFRQKKFVEGPVIHACSSVSAAFCATTCAAPFDSLLTQYQAYKGSSPLTCVVAMYNDGGVRRFFRGWSLFFARVSPLFLIQLPLYEQCRKYLGMDFMR